MAGIDLDAVIKMITQQNALTGSTAAAVSSDTSQMAAAGKQMQANTIATGNADATIAATQDAGNLTAQNNTTKIMGMLGTDINSGSEQISRLTDRMNQSSSDAEANIGSKHKLGRMAGGNEISASV